MAGALLHMGCQGAQFFTTQEEGAAMARQGELDVEGIKRKRIKELDDAAEFYVEQRDTRMQWTKKEKEAKVALLKVMKKKDLLTYRDDDAVPPLVVTRIEGEDDVKVSVAKEAEPAEAAAEKPKRGRSAAEQRKLSAVNEEPANGDGTDDDKDEG